MKKLLKYVFTYIVRTEHLITPIAIMAITRQPGNVMSRNVYIFGIRVAYWTVLVD